jgi:ElaB/YqjD/DUF883 family membrane-anchored ribosome-binding protein
MKPQDANDGGLQDELSNFLDDIISLARDKTGIDAARLDELKQGFRARVDQFGGDATDAVREAAQDLSAQAQDAMDRVDMYAHEKPWQLVLAAGLIGLAVGVLVARR